MYIKTTVRRNGEGETYATTESNDNIIDKITLIDEFVINTTQRERII